MVFILSENCCSSLPVGRPSL